MSNSKKITDLTAYTDSQVQSNDLLFITDVAEQETKKITAIDVADYVFNAKTSSIFNGNYTGSFTGSFTGSLYGTSSWATNALTAAYASSGGGSGESNTASNIGTSGVGLFKQKSGVDLQFKNLVAGTNVSLNENLTENTLTIDLTSTQTPGGSTGDVQFNAPGSQFSGNSNFSWDTTNNNKLTVVGNISSTTFSSSTTNNIGYYGTASFANNTLSSSYVLTSSYSTTASNATTASYFSGTGAILSANSVVYSAKQSGTGTSWVNTGLTITITPKSTNSKFLIYASLVLANGDPSPGCAVAGLFKDSTALIDPFATVNFTMFDASPQSTTYLDAASDLSSRTYVVKVKATDASGQWFTNQSSNYPSIYWATSSMTILEFNI